MKIQRYLAPDMRQAMQRIRAELGPDAVILSTVRTDQGIEVSAAVDFEAAEGPLTGRDLPTEGSPAAAAAPLPEPDSGERGPEQGVGGELRRLRQLLETQLAALAWNDFTRREPQKARVLEDLTRIGIARDVALNVVDELPAAGAMEQSGLVPLALLARRLPTVGGRGSVEPGVLALVGPNGAGKSTTLAKLATRWVMEQGPGALTLVSADRDRLGSHEQLLSLGRLLGVPACIVEGPQEMGGLLGRVAGRGLVLLDTPGIPPRSGRVVTELVPLLAVHEDIEVGLVLSASAQSEALSEAIERYAPVRPAHCVLTRLDEAATLGGALSALIAARLPLAWVANGPRIPDDLERARAPQLVALAVKLARSIGTADSEQLARRFGSHLHAAA